MCLQRDLLRWVAHNNCLLIQWCLYNPYRRVLRKNTNMRKKISYLSNFSDAILAALIIWWLGTHLTTRFGSARMGEWILISLTMEADIERK